MDSDKACGTSSKQSALAKLYFVREDVTADYKTRLPNANVSLSRVAKQVYYKLRKLRRGASCSELNLYCTDLRTDMGRW